MLRPSTKIYHRISLQLSERENINFIECPIEFLLDMAIADNAFEGISTLSELYSS